MLDMTKISILSLRNISKAIFKKDATSDISGLPEKVDLDAHLEYAPFPVGDFEKIYTLTNTMIGLLEIKAKLVFNAPLMINGRAHFVAVCGCGKHLLTMDAYNPERTVEMITAELQAKGDIPLSAGDALAQKYTH